MIVVSLLLILVAVTLLVLGLAGGSSPLLISSIVASLLAAVFLVIGARQAAARRRTAAVAPDGIPADAAHDPVLGEAGGFAGRGSRRRRTEPATAAAGSAPGAPADDADLRGSALRDVRSDFSGSDGILAEGARPPADDAAGPVPGEDRAADRRQEPDYDHASSVIGAARAQDDQSWRRDPEAAAPDGAAPDGAAPDGAARDGGVAEETDEFGEPDADDPADEPLPQAVRPGDAVRMARIDAEVLVVDGRPRYHVADCPHLVGRLTEPLPAREAVELGFSPCGLCRPVDRLVAQTAHQ